jgi:hypothetical protein
MILLNLLNIHGFSNVMMKPDLDKSMMPTSGKELEMIFLLFLLTKKKN